MSCSGSVEIVESLLPAQPYVRLISSFPCQVTPVPTASDDSIVNDQDSNNVTTRVYSVLEEKSESGGPVCRIHRALWNERYMGAG
jgi:hypothetical protein